MCQALTVPGAGEAEANRWTEIPASGEYKAISKTEKLMNQRMASALEKTKQRVERRVREARRAD